MAKSSPATPAYFTVGSLAVRLRVQEYHLRALIRRGLINPSRAGRAAIFSESDIPTVERALVEAGYLDRQRS